jgi:hypothetical protein
LQVRLFTVEPESLIKAVNLGKCFSAQEEASTDQEVDRTLIVVIPDPQILDQTQATQGTVERKRLEQNPPCLRERPCGPLQTSIRVDQAGTDRAC